MIDPLRIEQHGQVPVGRLSGEVDISAVPVLRDRLLRVLDNHGEGLVIDLTDTTYIDSAVVNMLFEVAERLGLHQLRLVVVVPEDGLVDRVLTIVDLSSVADIYRRFDEAIQAFGTEPPSPASPPPARRDVAAGRRQRAPENADCSASTMRPACWRACGWSASRSARLMPARSGAATRGSSSSTNWAQLSPCGCA